MSHTTIDMSEPLFEYLLEHSLREPDILAELRERTASLDQAAMQISPEQGQLMRMLVRLIGAKTIIEVGTFTGYSALSMAMALPDNGHLIACDVSEEWTAIGAEFWERAGVRDRIDLRIAPALKTLDGLGEELGADSVDLAFLDADKTNYPTYVDALIPLLRPNGLLLVDNVLWGGGVLEQDPDSAETRAIQALNNKLYVDDRVDVVMLPIGDGLTLARKRRSRW